MKRFVLDFVEHGHMEEGRGTYLLKAGETDIQAVADDLFDSICGDPGARIPTVHQATIYLYEFDDSDMYFEQDEDMERTEIATYRAERELRANPVYVKQDDMTYVRSFDYNC